MREPLKLAENTINVALGAHYGINTQALTFLPLGNDSASAAYQVEAVDGQVYFLKVRTGAGFSEPSLAIPHYLSGQDLPHIQSPLPTLNGKLWVTADDFALSLYPFIDGRTGTDVGLSEQQWHAFGALMRRVHASQPPTELLRMTPREPYVPHGRDVLAELQAAVTEKAPTDRIKREFAAFWRARQDDIHRVIDRADTLGSELRQAALPLVLCHADPHTWNILMDAEQRWWLVDWDEVILAPKERDLMFVIGSIGRDLVSPHETSCFLEGYGDAAVDPQALIYYRYAWAAQDMTEYGERACFTPGISEESRRDALLGFMDLFEPGNIVNIAFTSEDTTLGCSSLHPGME